MAGRRRRWFGPSPRWILGCWIGVCLLSRCGGAEEGAALLVFAAASTTDVSQALAEDFESEVSFSFGPSSGLARQIMDGAPADVVLTANRRWVDVLQEAGRLDGPAVVLARNRLVCVAQEGGELARRWREGVGVDAAATSEERALAVLLACLGEGDRIALADESVPAGELARQSLERGEFAAASRSRWVGQDDVRSVLRAVESGQAVAGFVYATDARVGRVERLFELDPAGHDPAEVYGAVIAGARDLALARAFLRHLGSDRVRERWASWGFLPPSAGGPR